MPCHGKSRHRKPGLTLTRRVAGKGERLGCFLRKFANVGERERGERLGCFLRFANVGERDGERDDERDGRDRARRACLDRRR